MRTVLVIPAVFLGGALTLLSVLANFYFGYLLSSGPERWLYAFLFAFLDATKTFLLPWRDAFLENGDAKRARWALRAFVVFALVSFAAEFGLYKTIKGQVASETVTATSTYDLMVAPKTTAQADLAKLKDTRDRAEIVRDIDNKKLDPVWRRSKSCADVTLPDSGEFCRGYNDLVAERNRFDERQRLKDVIAAVDATLLAAGGTLATMNKQADAQAVSIAKLTGLSAPLVSDILGLLIAFLVEMGSVLMPWFACAKAKEGTIPSVPAVPDAADAHPAAKPAPPPDLSKRAERAAQAWFDAHVVRRRGGSVLSSDLGVNHDDYCDDQQEPALDKTSLGKFMRKRGHISAKKGGVMRYEGIALVPVAGKPKLRVAADNTGRLGSMARRG